MGTEDHKNKSKEKKFFGNMLSTDYHFRGKYVMKRSMQKIANRLNVHNYTKRLGRKKFYKNELIEYSSMVETTYTITQKTCNKRKFYSSKQVLKPNSKQLNHFCNNYKLKKKKCIRKALPLSKHNGNRNAEKRKTKRKEESAVKMSQSLGTLISSLKKDIVKKDVLKELFQWSMKPKRQQGARRSLPGEQLVQAVPIVPPLPLDMLGTAPHELPSYVVLRRTPSVSPIGTRKQKCRQKCCPQPSKDGRKPCPAEVMLPGAMAHKCTRTPRQVSASTFRATRVHYRYLLAKYGKSRLTDRQRVFPIANKSTIYSNFSIINLLHDVEESILRNKYSKQTDRIVKSFKEELDKDLLYTTPFGEKSDKLFVINPNLSTKRKPMLPNLFRLMSYSGTRECDSEINDKVFIQQPYCEFKSECNNAIKDKELKYGVKYEFPSIDSGFEILKTSRIKNEAKDKTNNKPEKISNISDKRKSIVKDDKNAQKEKAPVKELGMKFNPEENKLNALIQEVKKQLKFSEQFNPLLLTKGDSLTELNFAEEPITYVSMNFSPTTIDSTTSQSDLSQINDFAIACIDFENPQSKALDQEILVEENSMPTKKQKKFKRHHYLPKSYMFKIENDYLENKPAKICNIVTALDKVNKLLSNIPIQYDEKNDIPYILYNSKNIIKVIKKANLKRINNFDKRIEQNIAKVNINVHLENDLELKNNSLSLQSNGKYNNSETVGNQFLKCMLNSMRTVNQTNVRKIESQPALKCIDSDHEAAYQSVKRKTNIQNYVKQLEYTPFSTNNSHGNRLTESTKTCSISVKKVETNFQKAGLYYQVNLFMKREEYFLFNEFPNQYENNLEQDFISYNKQKERRYFENENKQCAILKVVSGYNYLNSELKNNRNITHHILKIHPVNENRCVSNDNIRDRYKHYNMPKKCSGLHYSLTRKHENSPVNLTINSNADNNIKNHYGVKQIDLEAEYNIKIENIKNYNKAKYSSPEQNGKHCDVNELENGGLRRINSILNFKKVEKIHRNKKNLFNTLRNESDFTRNSSSTLFASKILRSATINTIDNPRINKKGIITQAFYCQVDPSITAELQDSLKKNPCNIFFFHNLNYIFENIIKPKKGCELLNFIKYNQQVDENVKVTEDLIYKRAKNICKMFKISKWLSVTVSEKKILLQNHLYLNKRKKLVNFEKGLDVLNSGIENLFIDQSNQSL